MEEPPLLSREEDGILIVTLNRPAKLNALNRPTMELFDAAVLRFRDTPELKVMLIRATGRYFCAGVDLNTLVGKEFEVQGVTFRGREECRPCYWMDQSFGPGAEAALRGRGGLRAEILADGILRRVSE